MPSPEDSSTAIRPSNETDARPADARGDSTVRFTPGTLLAGRYRIVSPLGKGGMGEVYRADDIRLGQPVALKFLSAAFAADSGRIERLVDEVRVGRQISHPNVCRLYDIAEAEGHHFLVMEYVDGEDLASLLRRIGRLPGDKALDIARGVCAGLAAAHDKGVIHRDLKPANVMIDGHGHARIADFGLAALASGGGVADMSGTPQYMAPEQLTGGGASLRSDVYALGLVLHEMLSGKRVFEAKSLSELRALHAETKPLSLSSGAKDIDPGLERVILRCLARDPKDRPESARTVLGSLPGGDPLQAALLAGETPSPEMVAAASKVGDLRPSVAWAGLILGLIGLLLVAGLFERAMLYHVAPLTKPPEALVERAKEVLNRLGYRETPADSAYGFEVDREAVSHVKRQHVSPDWWRSLGAVRPGPYRFYYRQSQALLWSRSWTLTNLGVGPAELGRVTRRDPPPNTPGMTEVVLDAQGRLVSFLAAPPRVDVLFDPGTEPNWPIAIAEAGFDPAGLRPATPRFAAPVDSDRKAAWDGVNPEDAGAALHFEAASYRARLVYFEVRGPWMEPRSNPSSILAGVTIGVFILAIGGGVALLARRNLRLGRGDRRGAFRLATFGFVTLTFAHLFHVDHTSEWLPELHLILQIVSQALLMGTCAWLTYMALEPAVRRRSPETLISWSRLLAGRFLDPLVGRDVLLGLLAALAGILVFPLARQMPAWFGQPPMNPLSLPTTMATLSAPWHIAYAFFLSPVVALVQSLVGLFLLYLLHALVKRAWVARLLLFVGWIAIIAALTRQDSGETVLLAGTLVMMGTFGAVWVALLVRFGQLSSTVFIFTFDMLVVYTPLTLDWSAWYAGRSFAVLGFFAALLIAAFYTSLGGKPLFGKALLDD